jgi:hypothetical protein
VVVFLKILFCVDDDMCGLWFVLDSSGELLKSMVYGAMDGIVTTFAIVCAAAGAEQSDSVIVTMVIEKKDYNS